MFRKSIRTFFLFIYIMNTHDISRAIKIARLNDTFRRTFLGGRVILTTGVSMMNPEQRMALFTYIQMFDKFTSDNDPYKEHDFGQIIFSGEKYYWKIDYYNLDTTGGSEDPVDPSVTRRVMTIMRADEY